MVCLNYPARLVSVSDLVTGNPFKFLLQPTEPVFFIKFTFFNE
jgi:hypothetical protein